MIGRRGFIAALLLAPFAAREALRLRLSPLSPLKRIGSVMTFADWGYSFEIPLSVFGNLTFRTARLTMNGIVFTSIKEINYEPRPLGILDLDGDTEYVAPLPRAVRARISRFKGSVIQSPSRSAHND